MLVEALVSDLGSDRIAAGLQNCVRLRLPGDPDEMSPLVLDLPEGVRDRRAARCLDKAQPDEPRGMLEANLLVGARRQDNLARGPRVENAEPALDAVATRRNDEACLGPARLGQCLCLAVETLDAIGHLPGRAEAAG